MNNIILWYNFFVNGLKLLLVTFLSVVFFMSFAPAYAQISDDEKNKSIDKYFSIGQQLENSRLFVEAVSQYDRAIALDPKNVNAYVHKGLSLTQIGRYREALESFNKVLEINPKDASVYVYIAETYLKQGDMDRAKDVYDDLLKIDEQKAKILLQKIQQGPVNKDIRT